MHTYTIREMVIEQAALAHLFERHGIDYCCNAEDTLEAACAKKGLDVESILLEIRNLEPTRSYSFLHCDLWDLEFLVDYIVRNHHKYLQETMPVLATQLKKLIDHHGEKYPYLKPVAMLFAEAQHEMEQHMRKEEMILFPYIKSLASAKEFSRARPRAPFFSVDGPLARMEEEHADMGMILLRIRALLNDFHIPDSACNTYRSVVKGMQAFIKDVHQHVHLENNLLFPRARMLEQSFEATTRTKPVPTARAAN
jgi:regulator of cell morphogenesis and NO signaling